MSNLHIDTLSCFFFEFKLGFFLLHVFALYFILSIFSSYGLFYVGVPNRAQQLAVTLLLSDEGLVLRLGKLLLRLGHLHVFLSQ